MPRINIAFDVFSSGDPKTLKVGDYSDWLTIKNDPSVIKITVPGAQSPVTYSFVKGAINSFNSTSLYMACSECDEADLSDGIYFLRVEGAGGHFAEKYYLKTDVLQLEIDKKIINLGFSYTDEVKSKWEQIEKILFYLESAKARTKEGDIREAHRFFSEAQTLTNCKNCH